MFDGTSCHSTSIGLHGERNRNLFIDNGYYLDNARTCNSNYNAQQLRRTPALTCNNYDARNTCNLAAVPFAIQMAVRNHAAA